MTIHDFLPKFIKKVIADKARQTITAEYWNEMFNLLVSQGDWGQEAIQIIMDKLSNDVLLKSNTDAWVPTTNFQPATRKFVTDQISYMGGGDMLKSVYDINNAGVVDNAAKLGGQLPAYFATASALAAHINAYKAYKALNDTKNNEQDTNLNTLNVDVARYKLIEQFPMKQINFSSAQADRTAGNYTLATIPLERVYNYAQVELEVGNYNSSGVFKEGGDGVLHNLLITPGFKQIYASFVEGTDSSTGYQGNIFTLNTHFNDGGNLGVEQVGNNLLIKVYNEPTSTDLVSYAVRGVLW